jgi:hypothetical protein
VKVLPFFGLLDARILRVIDLHVDRAHAEQALARILRDHPDRADRYRVACVDLSGPQPRIDILDDRSPRRSSEA